MELQEVDELPDTTRGIDGFGSTGKWITQLTKKRLRDFQDK